MRLRFVLREFWGSANHERPRASAWSVGEGDRKLGGMLLRYLEPTEASRFTSGGAWGDSKVCRERVSVWNSGRDDVFNDVSSLGKCGLLSRISQSQ